MLFSERNGHVAPLKALAPDEITLSLRNSLWNEISEWVNSKPIKELCTVLWKEYYKKPIDRIPYRYHDPMEGYSTAWEEVRDKFYKSDWHAIYDFLEFLIQTDRYVDLERRIDRILKRELAAYRIINKQFVQITDQLELDSLAESMGSINKFKPVANHIESSLRHLSNRQNPDYRNSIKESISAVEAMAKIISNNSKASLDDALKIVESTHGLHGGLRKAYTALYGYTSDSDGIRHALMTEPNLSQADAKYFLITCSSFVNYLKSMAK
jgi:hypothetical protein